MTGLEYQEHIQHTHNAFCKIVIRHTAIDMALRFEENECILVAMFQEGSSQGTIEKIHSILPYMGEDVEMLALINSTLERLETLSDKAFLSIDWE